jgi:molybdopterin-guanine dinucleotide biosynthesis protein B
MYKIFGGSVKPIIFCGFHNSGKTTLMAKAVSGLRDRGWKVSAIKHMASDRYVIDKTHDTGILLQSGCEEVTALADSYSVHYQREREIDPVERLRELLRSRRADYILIEGFKSYKGNIPKIVFGRTREEIRSLIDKSTIAYSGIGIDDLGFPRLRFVSMVATPENVAEFIETHTEHLFP